MTLDAEIREQLEQGDLRGLFLGLLGWDQPGVGPVKVELDETGFTAVPIAQKRGLHILEVRTEPDVPPADVQHRLDAEIAQRLPERLVVFTGPARQVWRWPQPRKSGGTRLVPHEVRAGHAAPGIVQRLAGVQFTFSEEDTITLPAVKDRVRAQFNAERVTNAFYERFQEQHTSLQDALEGIDGEGEARWYASVLMNRLMFIYFVQKKGFLNEDRDYLRSCLAGIRELRGDDEFYGFYRDVLIPMFHQGFGSVDHAYEDPEIAAMLGDVPYVNGGIFEEHEIESSYEIQVPDSEFERIFGFFDEFRWHLDDREQGDPNAINPDVIGYIFERYVNLTAAGQKEGGAYYTKEDVTGYMASVTVLPRVLDRTVAATGVNPFVLLQARPRRYLHEAMLHGHGQDGWLPVPAQVAELHADPLRWHELSDAGGDPDVQLAGESWVETLDRREHVDRLLGLIAAGEVNTIDALITHNLDVRTIVADLLHDLDSPAHVAEVWRLVTDTTVIDPTCGSGAFLFAALDLLDEIYAALLERARTHLATGDRDAHEQLADLVAAADEHPNDDYYRRKHAALSNLFGLDVMREAVETAKLRLFLSLVAKLETREEIEPLPDLDFNLRTGNLLVGFRDVDDARGRVGSTTFDALAAVDEFVPRAQLVADARARFVDAQRTGDHTGVADAKDVLSTLLGEVRESADRAYATAAGLDVDTLDFEAWWLDHLPFHWMLEFPAIVEKGGFDVVVGNPPYIKPASVSYEVDGYATQDLPDLYAPCVERSLGLLRDDGRFSMILPISFQFSDRHKEARRVVLSQGAVWASTYSRNPSALFTAGLGVRNTIVVTSPSVGPARTTCTRRWQREAREDLFPTTRYSALTERSRDEAWLVRTGDQQLADLLAHLRDGERLGSSVARRGGMPLGFKVTALYYLPVYTQVPPVYDKALEIVPPPKDSKILFENEEDRLLAFALLAGELALIWWASTGDDFDVTATTLKDFPISFRMVEPVRAELLTMARELEQEAHKPEHLLFTPYAGLMTGVWDLRRLRPLTRRIDQLVLETIGRSEDLPAVIRAVSRFDKSTGERPGTERGLGWLDARRALLQAI
jgi:Eco57I restriction-modification methylase